MDRRFDTPAGIPFAQFEVLDPRKEKEAFVIGGVAEGTVGEIGAAGPALAVDTLAVGVPGLKERAAPSEAVRGLEWDF